VPIYDWQDIKYNKEYEMNFETRGIPETKENYKKGFELLPEDDYIGRIEKVEEKTSQAGNSYINLWLRVTQGAFSKRIVFRPIFLIGKSEESTKKLLGQFRGLMADLGITPSEKRDTITSVELLRQEIQNITVEFNVYHENDMNNQLKEKVGEVCIYSEFGTSCSPFMSEPENSPLGADSTAELIAECDAETALAKAETEIPFGNAGELSLDDMLIKIRALAMELKIDLNKHITATTGKVITTDKLDANYAEAVLLSLIAVKQSVDSFEKIE